VVSFTNRAGEGVSKRATELRPIVTLSEVDLAGFRDMLIDAAIGVLRSRLPRKANEAGVRSGT
jgi:hypothetical protein